MGERGLIEEEEITEEPLGVGGPTTMPVSDEEREREGTTKRERRKKTTPKYERNKNITTTQWQIRIWKEIWKETVKRPVR